MKRLETHAHSHFSNLRLLDSINRPKDLILTANELGLAGICLTDHETISGAVEWLLLEKELKSKEKIPQDFKCGIGNEIYLIDERHEEHCKYYHYILIAKDTVGFRQLCKLSSIAWYNSYSDRGMLRTPTLKTELAEVINEDKGHIIATSACIGGELGANYLRILNDPDNKMKYQKNIIDFLNYSIDLFGEDFYVEVAPSLNKEQINFNEWILRFCKNNGMKMIYGTDAHYLTEKQRNIHKAYLNSKEGEREVDDFYAYSHLMSNEEAFGYLKESGYAEDDFKILCENSMEIYDKIKTYDIFRNPIIPRVDVYNFPKLTLEIGGNYPIIKSLFNSDNIQERYWINSCWNSLLEKDLIEKKYIERLETEADIIKTVGDKLGNCMFEYFNTFQHFIDLFWECGSLSGPGRGSSVCFLSNYLLGITQLNPLDYNLAEWRFLNKERLELPDIDTDLSPLKRPLIFKKIREERGELRVLQVATFSTEKTKSAIKTACRGYRSNEYPNGINVDDANYITNLIPHERGYEWTMHSLYYGDEETDHKPVQQFVEEVAKYDGLLEIILSLEGLIKGRGVHASGVILYNEDPWNTDAIMRAPSGDLITQFSLHEAEKLGDTKFDFLVTNICDKITLTIELLQDHGYFDKSLSLRDIYEQYLHPSKIDLNDERMWDILHTGTIPSLFQFDSPTGGAAIKAIKPRNPLELMMANALTRLAALPGQERPMNRYVRFKNDISLWYNEMHERGLSEDEIKVLEPYYLPCHGCPTTQEKLMLLSMEEKLSNFSLAEANAARKIISKKLLSKIPELHDKILTRCPNPTVGEYVWDTCFMPQSSYSFAEPCNGVNTPNRLINGVICNYI